MSENRPEKPPVHLSVIIPAFNEERRIGPTLESIIAYLEKQDYTWEILVIDDGSSDQTVAVSEEACGGLEPAAFRIHRQPHNMGKGAAIKTGMAIARGAFRLFTDADNSTPIEEVEKLFEALKRAKDAEIAIGSRAIEGARIEVHQPWYREMMGRTFNVMVRLICIGGIKDTQCGFKLFSARAAEAIFPEQRLPGFSFDVEILTIARKKGFRIAETPVRWFNEPSSKVSPLWDSAKMFFDLLRIRFGR